MSRARVLILLQNEPVPSDRHVWNQTSALARAGYDVVVICPKGEDRDRAATEVLDGVEIHRYEPRRAEGGALTYAVEYSSALWSIARLARQLARERPFDVVHACSPPDVLLLAALPLRRRGTRLIFDHHDLTPELYASRFGGEGGAVHRATLGAEQIAFRLADVVLSVNESYRRIAITRGRRNPEDVFVVRTGPDLTRFVQVPADPLLKRGKAHLLSYAGVMGPQDGVDHALRALALLRDRREDWHAIFMGDGEVLPKMRHLNAALGLQDLVEFTGWVEHDEIGRVLSSSDVCLAPDPSSPLNDVSSMVKLSEYMAMSRPIVSFDLEESRIAAGDAADFATGGDEADFARLVDGLLDDSARRRAMGAAGRERAERVLAWEHQERALLAAYDRALAGGASAPPRPPAAVRGAPSRAAVGNGSSSIPAVGVIVLGGDYQGLGIVRSLGRRGVPVRVFDDERSIARHSRYAGGTTRLSDMGDERRLVEELGRAARVEGLEGWVLFPTRDETVAAIARNRDVLSELFRVPTAGWDTIRWAWDKRSTYQLAAELGIPAPRTWQPRDVDALETIDAEPPFAIKPAIKEHFFYATKAKAWRADTRAELRELYERARRIVGPGEVMVQELIPGDGHQQYAYCALYERGAPIATMVARRLRQHPPEFGRASTYVETTDDPVVEELSRRFLGHLGFDGLVELEYKLDPRDGRYKLLDFNARTWGYHSLAPEAGVDFPYLLFQRQLGRAVEPQRARPGVRWVRILTDFPTAVVEIAEGRIRPRAYLRSLRSADTEAVFCRDDPKPGLAELVLLPYLSISKGF